jgi:NAD(P)H dehydrogenase (quinone)
MSGLGDWTSPRNGRSAGLPGWFAAPSADGMMTAPLGDGRLAESALRR